MESDEERVPRRFIVASGGYETQIRLHDQDANLVRTLQFPDVQVLHISFSGRRSSPAGDRLLLAVGGSPKIGVYDISPEAVSPTPFYMYDMHTAAVTCVGFEPSASEFLYSSSEDGTLQVWIPVTRNPEAKLPRNTLRTYFNRGNISSSNLIPINDTVFHPEKMLYFTVDSLGRLRIWDHNEKKGEGLTKSIVPHKTQRHLQCIDISSDYSMVVMANLDGLVFIYRVDECLSKDKPVPAIIRPSGSYVTRVRLSESMNLLACPLTSGIKVFRMRDINLRNDPNDDQGELQDVSPVQLFGDRPGWIWDASFVGDSEDYLITCSSNTSVRLWDLNSFSKSRDFPPSRKAVVCLAVKEFLPDTPPSRQQQEVLVASPDQQQQEQLQNEVLHQPQPQNPINHGVSA